MPNDKEQKTLSLRLPVKVFVALFSLFVLFLHVFSKNDRVDGTAALLLAMAILPWFSDLLDTLELPGGWKDGSSTSAILRRNSRNNGNSWNNLRSRFGYF